jgi:hypothetical protein
MFTARISIEVAKALVAKFNLKAIEFERHHAVTFGDADMVMEITEWLCDLKMPGVNDAIGQILDQFFTVGEGTCTKY